MLRQRPCSAGLPKGQPDGELLALYVGTAGLYSGLAQLAATGSANACGLAQLLTHETRQMTNRCAHLIAAHLRVASHAAAAGASVGGISLHAAG